MKLGVRDKIWITGSHGRLGSTIYRYLDPIDAEIVATDKNEVDITNQKEVSTFIERLRPTIIVNASGLSKKNECEKNPDEAYLLNAIGAKNIAIAANRHQTKIVQLSTGDVFDGNTINPFKEIDTPRPNTVYGKSKFLGEEFVRNFSNYYFIIRVSRLYSRENAFVENIIDQAKKGKVVMPKDRISSPTPAFELSKFLIELIKTSNFGTYHASCEGYCSHKEFAQEVMNYMGLEAEIEEVIDESKVDMVPSFRGIRNYYLDITGGYKFNDWKSALHEYIDKEGLNGKK
ncbi:NAD(P)-dependent oxidoreductase [Anaerococcus sp.]|uniref:SDR family oxidoreductase n=1 Tax=Anaerococcus sp. TaxID=1872515 RepID=UPI0027BA0D02|nr:NAD(P)-dependent oxidoreductase [Anaerococcus sp.]